MKIGIFQRASLAIVLIGPMLMPFGICLTTQHKTEHSCCAAPDTGKSAQSNCCVVRDQLPAVVVATTLPNTAAVAVTPAPNPLDAAIAPSESLIAVFIPPSSPPPGAFNLRI